MKKILITLIFVVFTPFTFAEPIHLCQDGCQGNFSLARGISNIYWDGQIFSIINTNTFEVSTYRTEISTKFGEPIWSARQITTTANALNVSNNIKRPIQNLRQSTIQIPENVTDSAFNLMNNSRNRNNTSDFINSNLGFVERVEAVAGSMLGSGIVGNFRTLIPVQFSDGSTADFVVTGIDEGFSVVETEFVPTSARDSDNNTIPNSAASMGGTFEFPTESNFNNFLNLGTSLGASFFFEFQCTQVTTVTCIVGADDSVSCTSRVSCL